MVVWSSWPFYIILRCHWKKSISWAPPCTDTVDDFLDFLSVCSKRVLHADISWAKNETVIIKSILLAFAIAGLLMGDDLDQEVVLSGDRQRADGGHKGSFSDGDARGDIPHGDFDHLHNHIRW